MSDFSSSAAPPHDNYRHDEIFAFEEQPPPLELAGSDVHKHQRNLMDDMNEFEHFPKDVNEKVQIRAGDSSAIHKTLMDDMSDFEHFSKDAKEKLQDMAGDFSAIDEKYDIKPTRIEKNSGLLDSFLAHERDPHPHPVCKK